MYCVKYVSDRERYVVYFAAATQFPRPLPDAEERPGGLDARRVASPHKKLEGTVEGGFVR